MINLLLKQKIFQGLSSEQMAKLVSVSSGVTLTDGEVLLSEGDESCDFYLVLKGSLAVEKRSDDGVLHRLGAKTAGDLIGEMAFIMPALRSATLRAEEPCELIKVDGERIRSDPEYVDLYAELAVHMGRAVSENLRYTNDVTVKSMQAELSSAKLLVAAGRFMVGVVFIISTYIFSLGVLPELKKHLATTTPVSVGLLVFFSGASFIFIKRSGFPLKDYGLSLDKGWRMVGEAILFSIPLMLLIVFLKWMAIRLVPAFSQESLFHPFAVLEKKQAAWIDYIWVPLAYALFCPLQEFIARGVLQSSFHMFLKKKTWGSVWFAILLGNLLFAATHMHTSFGFAMLAFFPGLFWGWLFARQQSLLGVSVSHILIGLWAVFFVSFQTLV